MVFRTLAVALQCVEWCVYRLALKRLSRGESVCATVRDRAKPGRGSARLAIALKSTSSLFADGPSTAIAAKSNITGDSCDYRLFLRSRRKLMYPRVRASVNAKSNNRSDIGYLLPALLPGRNVNSRKSPPSMIEKPEGSRCFTYLRPSPPVCSSPSIGFCRPAKPGNASRAANRRGEILRTAYTSYLFRGRNSPTCRQSRRLHGISTITSIGIQHRRA